MGTGTLAYWNALGSNQVQRFKWIVTLAQSGLCFTDCLASSRAASLSPFLIYMEHRFESMVPLSSFSLSGAYLSASE